MQNHSDGQVPVEASAGPLRDLGYTGAVRLTAGPLADRLANVAQVYGGLSLDSVLKGFRERAGLAAPAQGSRAGPGRLPSRRSGSG